MTAMLLLGLGASLAAEDTDGKAARAAVERYFALYAKKDLDGAMALWSAKSPEAAQWRTRLRTLFADTGPITLKKLEVQKVEVKGGRAEVRVRAELAGDRADGKRHPALGTLRRTLSLVKEDGGWKLTRYEPVEAPLARALAAARSPEERQKLRDADKELVTGDLVRLLCQQGELRKGGDEATAEGRRYFAAAFEVAELLGDKAVLGGCYWSRGRWLRDLGSWEAAVPDYRRGLGLFHEAKDRFSEALLLGDLGNVYHGAVRHADALSCFQDSLKLFRELGDRKYQASVLHNLGVVYQETRHLAEAVERHKESLKIRRELGDRLGAAESLQHLGILAVDLGRYEEALEDHRESLKIRRELGDRAKAGQSLQNLGLVYQAMGRYEEALTHFQDSLKIDREVGDRKGAANSMNCIGTVYMATGRYPEAVRSFQESLKTVRELGDRRGEALAHNNLALVYHLTGRPAEALEHFRESLAALRALGDRKRVAEGLNNIGSVYLKTGRYAEALRHFRDSLSISREVGDRQGMARALTNLGGVYEDMGRFAEALEYHRDSLKIARELGDRERVAGTLNSIGVVCDRTGRDAEALANYQESLKIWRELGLRQNAVVPLRNIGSVYLDAGRFAEAGEKFEETLKVKRELGDAAGAAGCLIDLGLVRKGQRDYAAALKRFDEAFKLAESAGALDVCFRCEHNRGITYRAAGRWKEAVAAFDRAIRHAEQLRDNTREPSLQASLLVAKLPPYYGKVDCLLRQDRDAEAFAVTEGLRSRRLLDLLQTSRVDLRKGMSEEERKTEQAHEDRLTALGVRLADLRARKAGADRIEPLVKEQEKARTDLEEFRHALYVRHPDVEARRARSRPVTLTELNRGLFARHPRLVVLSYLVSDDETLLFVLTRGDRADGPAAVKAHRIDVTPKELAEAVGQFRAACQKPGVTPASDDLYRWLLAPAEDALDGAGHVVIVPDHALHALPFHALRPDEEGKYLVECCPVSYAPSLTALGAMAGLGDRRRRERGKEGGLLAIGIGDFGRREKALPKAEAEAKAVAGLFGGRGRTLLGTAATRARLQGAWAKARYLHLATHGLFDGGAGLYSSLVLSAADERDEGRLFARDLLDAELRAELVVLSACETGLGRWQAGEGMLSLGWAWFAAGVPAVVASQWPVSDDATEKLMTAFWAEVKAGTPHAEALRRAQLRLLKARGTRHPFYWAPFVLVGDFGG